WSCGALALGAAVLLFLIMGFRVSPLHMGGGRGELRVMTCNVHRQHLDAGALGAYIANVGPDVVALQGWSETGHESLFTGSGWDVRREGELLVASRFPIGSVRVLDILGDDNAPKEERGAAALVELRTSSGTVRLVA